MDLSKLSNDELLALKEQTEKEVTKWDNFQMARKIQINSLYGALGNQYFRHYRLDNAEAITLTGQVSIRWIESKMNQYLNKLLSTLASSMRLVFSSFPVWCFSLAMVQGI